MYLHVFSISLSLEKFLLNVTLISSINELFFFSYSIVLKIENSFLTFLSLFSFCKAI